MRKTNVKKCSEPIAVDIEQLMSLLCCGEATARKIGEDAEARIQIGRRVLYSVAKVRKYIELIAC